MIHKFLTKQNYIQSTLESSIIGCINSGIQTFDEIRDKLKISESVLEENLANFCATNLLRYNKTNNKYEWEQPLLEEIVFLNGDLRFPVNYIYLDDKLFVNKGREWIELDKHFDKRRIIWNFEIVNDDEEFREYQELSDTDLIALLRNSVVKYKKTKNKQLPEYENLRNKIIPFSDVIKLKLTTIGEIKTDCDLLMVITFDVDNAFQEYRKFFIKSLISTKELIECLELAPTNRRYSSMIGLDKMVRFRDIIVSGNCIPIKYVYDENGKENGLEYLELSFRNRSEIKSTLKEFNLGGSKDLIVSDIVLTEEELVEQLKNKENAPLLHRLIESQNFMLEILD